MGRPFHSQNIVLPDKAFPLNVAIQLRTLWNCPFSSLYSSLFVCPVHFSMCLIFVVLGRKPLMLKFSPSLSKLKKPI